MSRVPNAVAFVVAIGLLVTITTVLTTPAGARLVALVAGLITTVLFGLIVGTTRLTGGRRQGWSSGQGPH